MTVAFAIIVLNYQNIVHTTTQYTIGKTLPHYVTQIYIKIILALPRALMQRTKDIKKLTLSRHRLHLR